MLEYPVIKHMLIVGRPGSYKDVTAVKILHDAYLSGRPVISNCSLNGIDHVRINSLDDLANIHGDPWNPSILYIHDIGNVFNSRKWMEMSKKTRSDARKSCVNNMRKRGIEILGTCHREMEVDIDIRLSVSYFLYPRVMRVGEQVEDYRVVVDVYDEPEERKRRRVAMFSYTDPSQYMLMYDTLEEATELS